MDAAGSEQFAAALMLVLCSGERVQTFMPVEIGVAGGVGHG